MLLIAGNRRYTATDQLVRARFQSHRSLLSLVRHRARHGLAVRLGEHAHGAATIQAHSIVRQYYKSYNLIAFLLIPLALSQAVSAMGMGKTSTGKADTAAIVSAATEVLCGEKYSGRNMEFRITIEDVRGDFARARVDPLKKETDPALVYLRGPEVNGTDLSSGQAFRIQISKSLVFPRTSGDGIMIRSRRRPYESSRLRQLWLRKEHLRTSPCRAGGPGSPLTRTRLFGGWGTRQDCARQDSCAAPG